MQTHALTALKAVLSIAFLYYGLQKLGGFAPAVEMYERLGYGQAPRFMTGSAETLGALLLWWKGREVYAAILLTGTMVIGMSALLIYLGPPYFPVPYLLAACGFLMYAYRHQLPRPA
ncbi:DoxX-like protein [Litoreibacter ponti]|uniref:DoxX-like protein n=1 Tax=Litoreibacter ponti TaxID=1510457 RepID=A0A2T6BEC1_9RHOB|nr:DoxX family protein [Litoreibacter ponti]PTX54418.1 DoxX-like protein [Litoreibacter ponti]